MAPHRFLLLVVFAVAALQPHSAHAQPNDGFQRVTPAPLQAPRLPAEPRSLPPPRPVGPVAPAQTSAFAATVACSAHLLATGRGPFSQQVVVRIVTRRLTYERPFGTGTNEAGVERGGGEIADNGDVTVTGSQIAAGRATANVAFRGNICSAAPQLRGEYRTVREARVFRTCDMTFIDPPRR